MHDNQANDTSAKTESRVKGSNIVISVVPHAATTETRPVEAEKIICAIKSGRWEQPVKEIRRLFAQTLLQTRDRKLAKLAVDPLKKRLPAILPSGEFSSRANDALIKHSGLICGDLDSLGYNVQRVRDTLLKSPYVWALFLSPTGDGLKAIFRVSADPFQHLASFGAVERHVLQLTGTQIDQACKDLARLCFVSSDSDAYFNPNAHEIASLPKVQMVGRTSEANAYTPDELNERKRIAVELLGAIRWNSETHGFGTCPGRHLHTTGDGDRDCEVLLDGVPTIYCFHNHCRGILEDVNHQLRSRIGKAEFKGLPGNQERIGNLDRGWRQHCISHGLSSGEGLIWAVRDPIEETSIYPQLSEGKPGMLGAITNRAEAQVTRLSGLYALLDKSKLIRPEHHHAAMALWRYCEQSARWIFGRSTGDRDADKILTALRHAPNGKTKTEISAEVFNRHASSADIDEALRLLHGLGMVRYQTEASGGAPTQRWFFVAELCEKSE